jgi:ribosomal protein S18 acetylase RimI-like enzyme
VRKEDESGEFSLNAPKSGADWVSYFDLRWRVLRAPWNQPPGSERDNQEDQSLHSMVRNSSGAVVAVGRLHFLPPAKGQIRYMAVDEAFAGRGLGSMILRDLEQRASAAGVHRIVLSARKGAVPFYLKHQYVITGPADTLYGVIEHVRMEKQIGPKKHEDHNA